MVYYNTLQDLLPKVLEHPQFRWGMAINNLIFGDTKFGVDLKLMKTLDCES